MKSASRALVLALAASSLLWLAPGLSRAADIQCKSPEKKHEQLICGYSMLKSRYETIFREQQVLLQRAPDMRDAVSAWKKQRDACVDVPCLDEVFARWDRVAAGALDIETASAIPPEAPAAEAAASSEPAAKKPPPAAEAPPRVASRTAREPVKPAPARQPPPAPKAEIAPPAPSEDDRPSKPSPAVSADQIPTGDLLASLWKRYALLILGSPAVFFGLFLFGRSSSCQKCNKWFSARVVRRELTDTNLEFETVNRKDKYRDPRGKLIGTLERTEQVGVIVKTYGTSYRCRSCNHQWVITTTERSSGTS